MQWPIARHLKLHSTATKKVQKVKKNSYYSTRDTQWGRLTEINQQHRLLCKHVLLNASTFYMRNMCMVQNSLTRDSCQPTPGISPKLVNWYFGIWLVGDTPWLPPQGEGKNVERPGGSKEDGEGRGNGIAHHPLFSAQNFHCSPDITIRIYSKTYRVA